MEQMVAFIAPGKDKGELVDTVGSWIHPFIPRTGQLNRGNDGESENKERVDG